MVLLGGCAPDLITTRDLREAEDNLSYGKPMGEKVKSKPLVVSPTIEAKYTIARAMDLVISEKNDDNEIQETRKNLSNIRRNPILPHYLKVEAGYIMVMLDKIEDLKRISRASSQQKDKCADEVGRMKDENERMKKELDELRYKLQKIEEIHINTEKKRGVQ
jgi:cell division protein FtsB